MALGEGTCSTNTELVNTLDHTTKLTPDSIKSTNKRTRLNMHTVVLDDDVVVDGDELSKKTQKVIIAYFMFSIFL